MDDSVSIAQTWSVDMQHWPEVGAGLMDYVGAFEEALSEDGGFTVGVFDESSILRSEVIDAPDIFNRCVPNGRG